MNSESREFPGFPLELMGDNVAISPDRERERVGLIFLPEASREKPRQGVVVAIGPGKRSESGVLIPTRLAVGDRVLFGRFWGSDIEVDGQPILIGPEDEIHSRIEDDDRSLERGWFPRHGVLPRLTADEVRAALDELTEDNIRAVCEHVVGSASPDSGPDHPGISGYGSSSFGAAAFGE